MCEPIPNSVRFGDLPPEWKKAVDRWMSPENKNFNRREAYKEVVQMDLTDEQRIYANWWVRNV